MTTDFELKAIPTFYKGVQFKSRMEAQCAVLFDKLGWTWEYEKYSLMLPSGTSFIPDFWIEGQWLLVECRGYKSDRGDQQIQEFAAMLAARNERRVGIGLAPELELPNHNGEFYDFLVIGPDRCSLYKREWAPTAAIFCTCVCGKWQLAHGGDACQECLEVSGWLDGDRSFQLTVKAGRLLLNGQPLEETELRG